jgi:serine phosphatase RsbU (regulator of sigma subunit)
LLYTDGLIEARDRQRQEHGIDRLVGSFSRHAAENSANIVASVLDDVHHHAFEITDDMTVMALKWKH